MSSAPAGRTPGPSTLVSVIVLVAGLLTGAFGLYRALEPLVRTLVWSPAFPTNTESRLHLSKGTYLLYERTDGGAFDFSSGTTTISPSDVAVVSENGESIPVLAYTGGSEQLTRDGSSYTSAVRFVTPAAGEYSVRVRTPIPGRVIVARPLTDTFRDTLAWWGVAFAGGAIAITGGVLWIVGATRRRRSRLAGLQYAQYASPPPGWYPDPQQSGRLRYWNGTAWTEHVH